MMLPATPCSRRSTRTPTTTGLRRLVRRRLPERPGGRRRLPPPLDRSERPFGGGGDRAGPRRAGDQRHPGMETPPWTIPSPWPKCAPAPARFPERPKTLRLTSPFDYDSQRPGAGGHRRRAGGSSPGLSRHARAVPGGRGAGAWASSPPSAAFAPCTSGWPRRAGRQGPGPLRPAHRPAGGGRAGGHLPRRATPACTRNRCGARRRRCAGPIAAAAGVRSHPLAPLLRLHKARRGRFGGKGYDDAIARGRISQAFGRLIRRADDRGVFVMLDAAAPTRLFSSLPEGVELRKRRRPRGGHRGDRGPSRRRKGRPLDRTRDRTPQIRFERTVIA